MSHEATARLRSHIRSKKWESYKLFLLALPVIIYIFVFKYMPLWGWSYAFFSYRPGLSLAQCDFVGLQNFENLFGNAVMRQNLFRVLRNTFGIQILNYVLMPVPMLFAIFLSEIKSKRFQKVIQTVTTLPHFISWVIMFSLASSIFGSSGLINSMIHDMGFEATINILTTDDHVWITQALLNLWKSMGWNAIVYFAAITGLDQQVYEAAEIDGANRWQKISKITIPLLMPTFFVLLVINIGNFLNSGIDQFLAFSNALNMSQIEVLDLYVYNLGIGSGQISFSVAVGIMKSVVAVILFASANFASKKIRGTSVF
ncbi:MAG TPA: ABC transporter permease subunit [Candidatus Faecalibacterium intestinigallinarum]|uniref:ABC transporter permease subunit n=1 Tax=Candidatus Faecalibacterium intestinigallinarum TaxID=2838581 RepID=A0A9D1QBK5_9FIRM|nr:ABC transporter permease subunit [Candidatus Faecalibacterium intestinigallinarum]